LFDVAAELMVRTCKHTVHNDTQSKIQSNSIFLKKNDNNAGTCLIFYFHHCFLAISFFFSISQHSSAWEKNLKKKILFEDKSYPRSGSTNCSATLGPGVGEGGPSGGGCGITA
jgi:hypothetical protein